MVTVDEFSRLVSGIYRSAVSPDDWVVALNDIRCTVGAIGAGLSVDEGTSRRMTNVNIPAEAMTSYGEYYQYIDYVVTAVETGPVGLIRSGSELVGLKAGSEFDADWMCRYEMNDGLFVRLTDGAMPTCLILPVPKRSTPFDTPERVTLVNSACATSATEPAHPVSRPRPHRPSRRSSARHRLPSPRHRDPGAGPICCASEFGRRSYPSVERWPATAFWQHRSRARIRHYRAPAEHRPRVQPRLP